jgi:hypothetical protein
MRSTFVIVLALLFSVPSFAQQQTESLGLTSFNAVPRGPQVLLTWNPTQGQAVSYQLEKSKNGLEFVAFGQIEASQNLLEFLETDFQPYQGMSYYRLKITNEDGTFSYSNVVPIKYNAAGEAISPVPVRKTSSTVTDTDNEMLVVVRDQSGNEHYAKVEVSDDGTPVECVNPDPTLTAGTYTIIGCSDQQFYSKQLVVK